MSQACDVIALDVPLVLAGGLFYHVLFVLVLARLKLLCSSLFRLSITLHIPLADRNRNNVLVLDRMNNYLYGA